MFPLNHGHVVFLRRASWNLKMHDFSNISPPMVVHCGTSKYIILV